jgi:ketosteroid isomerase-like protein
MQFMSEKRECEEETFSTIVGLEHSALDRWCTGDPSGFLEISASDVVYFDPYIERRIDGLDELTRYYEGIRGQVQISRYELVNPKVQVLGDAAVLTFNYISHDGNEVESRWNCTEVYRREAAGWRIIQTHWSLTTPRRP